MTHVVILVEMIILPIYLGEDDMMNTCIIRFTVVESPSTYTFILGRPDITIFRVLASTFHQKIKYLVGRAV